MLGKFAPKSCRWLCCYAHDGSPKEWKRKAKRREKRESLRIAVTVVQRQNAGL